MNHAVEINNLTKNYNQIQALKSITLNVPEGTIYGLIGPNGAGKTTLIKALVGSIKPSSGYINILGLNPITDKWTLRRKIGYMPQSASLYEDLTAKENILFFGKAQKVENIKQKADEVLQFVELSDRANDLVRNFSGGMKKRVSLCCALIHQPKILFLDEPTAAIDPHLKLQSWNLFRKLADSGVTLFISTHLMDEALLCDKVTILMNGEIIAVDTPQKLIEQGKTVITYKDGGIIKTSTIPSTPEGLANELLKLGLKSTITEVSTKPDTIENIVLNSIRIKQNLKSNT